MALWAEGAGPCFPLQAFRRMATYKGQWHNCDMQNSGAAIHVFILATKHIDQPCGHQQLCCTLDSLSELLAQVPRTTSHDLEDKDEESHHIAAMTNMKMVDLDAINDLKHYLDHRLQHLTAQHYRENRADFAVWVAKRNNGAHVYQRL